MVSHNEQGQITLGWKSSQNLQGPHLHYPESDLLSAMHGLPGAAWSYPPLHRVQCLCQAEDISSQEWYESRCRERLWFLWALGNIPQRSAARFLQAENLLSWLLWGSGEEGGWLSTSQEAGGEVDGHHGQPGEPGPGRGDEQAGWRQGWGSQLGELTGKWRTKYPQFFKKCFWNYQLFLSVIWSFDDHSILVLFYSLFMLNFKGNLKSWISHNGEI